MRERSAGAVIYRNEGGAGGAGKRVFLLLNYPSGHWDFAKGKMERGETERRTAAREVAEETGIRDLRFVDGFEQTISYIFQYGKDTVRKKVVFFLAETGTERITLSDEHLDHAWMGLEDALKKVTFDNARSVLTNADGHLSRTDS